MTTKRLFLVATLLSTSVLAFGCSDPNKNAQDAHDAELKSERKQEQSNADNRSDVKVNAAEAQRDNTEANATGSSATKDRVGADAKLTEARAVYRAKATERLEKLDAKTAELQQRVDKAGGKAPTQSRDALKTVNTQHGLVSREIEAFPKVANDDFEKAKTSIDTQLDALEGLVKKAATEVDKIKNK